MIHVVEIYVQSRCDYDKRFRESSCFEPPEDSTGVLQSNLMKYNMQYPKLEIEMMQCHDICVTRFGDLKCFRRDANYSANSFS